MEGTVSVRLYGDGNGAGLNNVHFNPVLHSVSLMDYVGVGHEQGSYRL